MELGKSIIIVALICVVLFVIYQVLKWKISNVNRDEVKDKAKYGISSIFADIKERIAELKDRNKGD